MRHHQFESTRGQVLLGPGRGGCPAGIQSKPARVQNLALPQRKGRGFHAGIRPCVRLRREPRCAVIDAREHRGEIRHQVEIDLVV